MSGPSGFFWLRIGDGGTQRIAGGEDNLKVYVDEGLPSSSLEGVPSRVDATRVITWLSLVWESWADAFWKKFSFPPNIRVLFSSSGHRFMARTEEDRGGGDGFHVLDGGSHK